MGYGPVTFAELGTIDITEPGAPTFSSVAQITNDLIEAAVILPNADSDGSPLTGLTKLAIASLPIPDDQNPLAGLSMEDILAIPDVWTRTIQVSPPNTPEATTTFAVPVLRRGSRQVIAVACSDDVDGPA